MGDDLFCAAQRGDLDVLRRLLEQLLQEGAPSSLESAMKVAIWNDHGDVVREIATNTAPTVMANYYLEAGARRDSTAAVRVLLQCCRGAFSSLNLAHALQLVAMNGNAATMLPWSFQLASVGTDGRGVWSTPRHQDLGPLRSGRECNELFGRVDGIALGSALRTRASCGAAVAVQGRHTLTMRQWQHSPRPCNAAEPYRGCRSAAPIRSQGNNCASITRQ